MAAAAALNVVKQIEGLADQEPTPQMRECLVQLTTSLQFFLDHPDSRVRMGSARALLKLSRGYSEDLGKIDLSKASAALARCRSEEGDEEAPELEKALAEIVEGTRTGESATAETEASSTAPACSSKDAARGEVVLKVADESDSKANAAMVSKIIGVPGVVSVTLEGPHIIVTAKTVETARDPLFLEDLQSAMAESTNGGYTPASVPNGKERAASSDQGASVAAGSSDAIAAPIVVDEGAEPAYLDDDEAGVVGGPGAPMPGINGGPQWSFFSQSNWMTGRRVMEFDDDPTIAARLAKAKHRQEERKKQEEAKMGWMNRWLNRR